MKVTLEGSAEHYASLVGCGPAKLHRARTYQAPVLQHGVQEVASSGVLAGDGVASGAVVALSQQLRHTQTDRAGQKWQPTHG